jgi:conjugative transfer signal peptidase TraF
VTTNDLHRRAITLGLALWGLVDLVGSSLPHTPPLGWNATASAPLGLYRVIAPDPVLRGDLVLVDPPREVQIVAVRRGYLAPGVPLIKHVAALPGDRICADAHRVAINGRKAAIKLGSDSKERPLKGWIGCRTLTARQVFLLNGTVLYSFDGRYFGPVSRAAIVGRLRPLWTF